MSLRIGQLTRSSDFPAFEIFRRCDAGVFLRNPVQGRTDGAIGLTHDGDGHIARQIARVDRRSRRNPCYVDLACANGPDLVCAALRAMPSDFPVGNLRQVAHESGEYRFVAGGILFLQPPVLLKILLLW
jgi:hypothetical protein